MHLGRWRLDSADSGPVSVGPGENWRQMEGVGPMHCWNDPGLFDAVVAEAALRREYAP